MYFLILSLLILLTVLFIIHRRIEYSEHGRLIAKIPGIKGYPIIGNLLTFLQSPTANFYIYRNFISKFKGMYKTRNFHISDVFISDPEDIEILLSSSKEIKKGLWYSVIADWLGEGLLISTGEKWKQRRKMLTPAFHFSMLKDIFKTFNEGGRSLIEDLRKTAGEEVEIHSYITKFTLHSICQSAMGINLNDESLEISEYRKAISDITECFMERVFKLLFKTNFLIELLPVMKFQRKTLKTLHHFTNTVIDRRRDLIYNKQDSQNEEFDDVYTSKRRLAMLDLLLASEKEGKIDQRGIQEEVDTFTFEGHDTTASAIKFLLFNLANYPDVQNLVVEELKAVITSPEEEVSMDMLNKLTYLDQCVKESLRLYPPVYFVARTLTENVQFKNYVVPKDASVGVLIFDMHRNYKYYPDPYRFDPDRFTPENSAKRHPFAYIPFSAGPRNCIGQRYALFEIKSIITTILRNFTLHSVTKPNDLIYKLDLILNTLNPIKVVFKPREDPF